MRIGIDARMMGITTGGIGRYIEELVRHLADPSDALVEYVVFLKKDQFDSWIPPSPQFKKALVDIPWYGLGEAIFMPRHIARARVDLMHFPHWNVPYFYRGRFVLTVHDLILWHHPTSASSTRNPFFFWIKYLAYRLAFTAAVRRAAHIITPSSAVKEDLVRTLGVAEKRITVIPLGATHLHTAEAHPASSPPYFLYIGTAYPHKNLLTLIRAFNVFATTSELSHELHLVGRGDAFYAKVRTAAGRLPASARIIFHGFKPDRSVASLVRGATALIMPSLIEGFGLPGVEAQVAGVPVIASDIPVFHEVYGRGARYFPPKDIHACARAFYEIATNAGMRGALIEVGKKNIERLSWHETALSTARVFQMVYTRDEYAQKEDVDHSKETHTQYYG